MLEQRMERLQQEADRKAQRGDVVAGLTTNFPVVPPPGIAYSKNFARCQKDGPFAVQVRDS